MSKLQLCIYMRVCVCVCDLNISSIDSVQGTSIHVLFPVQAMVDDSKNGHMWKGYSSGDPIHACREQRNRRK